MRRLFGKWCLLGLASVAGCSSSTPTAPEAPAAIATTAATAGIVDLTNAERTRAGRAPLRANALLMEAAQIQAEQVALLGQLEHDLPGARYPRLEDRLAKTNYRWTMAAENLASSQGSVSEAVESWMNSPGHRENILNANFIEIGTGQVVDGTGRSYYVQVFARPD